MKAPTLKQRLGGILTEEEQPDADLALIARLSDELANEICMEAPLIVREYLVTFAQHRSDAVFAHAQRSELLRFLRSS